MMSNGILHPEMFIRLAISGIIGFIIGLDRTSKKKPAGIKTYTYVSVSCCLITLVSVYSVQLYSNMDKVSMDPLRLAAQIVSGLGFLGAGLILKDGLRITGLTSASMIFFAGATGIGIGVGFYGLVIVAVIIMLVLSYVGYQLEKGPMSHHLGNDTNQYD